MYRIFMTIDRGPMDKTAVCVFPWEREILEEIHGGGAEMRTIEEMCSTKGQVTAKTIKLPIPGSKAKYPPNLRSQLEVMMLVKDADESNPFVDLGAEWGRLQERYGMHPKINRTVAEVVFGNFASFRRAVEVYRKANPGDVVAEHDPVNDELEKAPADMNVKELKAELRKREIAFDVKMGVEELRDLLATAMV